jgi:HEPN domain-containing protein
MDIEKQINYWLTSSSMDWQTANDIYNSDKNFHYCLFICHLTIEKLLKAIVVQKTNTFPPKSHNLTRLAELALLDVTIDQIKLMEELNQFQLDTRYPDEKFSLYNKATKEFTTERISKIRELRQWLLNQLHK